MKIKKSDFLKLIKEELNNILKEDEYTGPVPDPKDSFQGTYIISGPKTRPTHVQATHTDSGSTSKKIKLDYEKYPDVALALMYAKGQAALDATKFLPSKADIADAEALRRSKELAMGVSASQAASLSAPRAKETATQKKSKNPIFERYFIQNSKKEEFQETPFGQIVADEVNNAVNALPEIRLARDVLEEQEFTKSATEVAKQVLLRVHAALQKMVGPLAKQMAGEVEKEALSQVNDIDLGDLGTDTEASS